MARLSLILILLIFKPTAFADTLARHFQSAKFKLGHVKITAYIADNDEKRERGLMYVEKLPKNTGMLFAFDEERTLGFWMKNTLLPLSIGFFDRHGVLVDVQEMKVLPSMMVRDEDIPGYRSKKPSLFALEMESHWFERNKIHEGVKLVLETKSPTALLKSLSPGH